MTKKEKLCIDFASRWKKSWDSYILVADGFSAGQVSMRDTILAAIEHLPNKNDIIYAINKACSEPVEVEFKDGEHQIGSKLVSSS